MGMSYDELSIYGRLRKIQNCGPYSMFVKLVQQWGSRLSPQDVRVILSHPPPFLLPALSP
jgi:NAD+ synthase (glutamine-hydrolysing)